MLAAHPTEIPPPSPATAAEAGVALRVLTGLRKNQKALSRVLIRPEGAANGEEISVPREAFELFVEVLRQLANGNGITIVPIHAELTTQEAADLLNVSRPYLIGLLDTGKIPHRLVGTRRRVLMADLLAYKKVDDDQRRKVLAELTAEGQDAGEY